MNASPEIHFLHTRSCLGLGVAAVLAVAFGCHGVQHPRVLPPPLPVPGDTVLPTEVSEAGLAAGNTTGTMEVSGDGDLLYEFPLWVPPGRNGVQPTLSLSYRSRGANGLLGVGWSIGGFSQITRCGQRADQIGTNAAIGFTSTDRFCLDGQQLFAINNGQYGADGTEYRTERDLFAKIMSGGSNCESDTAGCNGPSWFKVFLKNGRVLTYGSSADNLDSTRIEGLRISRSVPDESQPKAVTDITQKVRYAWALSRAEDRYGNGINYSYSLSQTISANGEPTYEFRPERISYTDTADNSWPAVKSVRFVYQKRPDVRTFYISGLRMIATSRLRQIDVAGPNPSSPALLRQYKFTYRNDSITQRSLLASITECDGQNACKSPLTFQWELGSLSFFDIDTGVHDETSGNSITPSDAKKFDMLQAADMQGTGLDDVLLLGDSFWNLRQNLGYQKVMAVGSPHIFDLTVPPLQVAIGELGYSTTLFVDIDGTGRAGVVSYIRICGPCVNNGSASGYMLTVWPSVPETTTSAIFNQTYYYGDLTNTTKGVYVADLGGGGLPALIVALNPPFNWVYYDNYGPPNYYGAWPVSLPQNALANVFALDVDASGTNSLMLRNIPPNSDPNATVGLWYVATKSDSSRNVALLAGESFPYPSKFPFNFCPPPTFSLCSEDQFIDLNGDGLPDVISYSRAWGGNPWLAWNTGNGFLDRIEIHGASAVGGPSPSFPPYFVNGQADPGILVTDMNGDGRQDIIFTTGTTGNVGVAAMLAGGSDFQVPFYLRDQGGAIVPLPDDPRLAAFADVNGDGLPDLIEVVHGELHVYMHMGARPDVITRINEGTGASHQVTWAPISNPAVHLSGSDCAYPIHCLKQIVWVVSDVANDYGAGAKRHFSYRYQEARSDVFRGWLGFSQRQEFDSATGIISTTTFDNTTRVGTGYPYAELPAVQASKVALDNGHLFSTQRGTNYKYVSEYPLATGNSIYSLLPERTTDDEFEYPSDFKLPRLTVSINVQPPGTVGNFNLQIDGVTYAANVGDGSSTGPQVLVPGTHTVGETGGSGTNLTSYYVSFGGDCAPDGTVLLGPVGVDKYCTVTNVGPEAVTCSVFDDGNSNMEGPSDAIFISGRKPEKDMACIPSGEFGSCHKWFGECRTVTSQLPVRFYVFDDAHTNVQGPSNAIYVSQTRSQVCVPGGPLGRCRKWFGTGVTSDGREVVCSVFDDGYADMTQASGAIFIPDPLPSAGGACIPNAGTGECRRWFGRCHTK